MEHLKFTDEETGYKIDALAMRLADVHGFFPLNEEQNHRGRVEFFKTVTDSEDPSYTSDFVLRMETAPGEIEYQTWRDFFNLRQYCFLAYADFLNGGGDRLTHEWATLRRVLGGTDRKTDYRIHRLYHEILNWK